MVVQQFMTPDVHVCLLYGVNQLLLQAAGSPAADELELIAVRQLHQVLGGARLGFGEAVGEGVAEGAHIVHWWLQAGFPLGVGCQHGSRDVNVALCSTREGQSKLPQDALSADDAQHLLRGDAARRRGLQGACVSRCRHPAYHASHDCAADRASQALAAPLAVQTDAAGSSCDTLLGPPAPLGAAAWPMRAQQPTAGPADPSSSAAAVAAVFASAHSAAQHPAK